MLKKLTYLLLLLLIATFLVGFGKPKIGKPDVLKSNIKDITLKIGDINSKLSSLEGTELDGVAKEEITYKHTSKSKYDDFFKNSAICYGGLVVTNTMSDDGTMNLKKFARTRAAEEAGREDLDEIIGDTHPDSLSLAQSIAILEHDKKQGKLSKEELKYFVFMAANLILAQQSLEASVKSAPELIANGTELTKDVKSDFEAKDTPGITKGLNNSISQLNKVKDEAPAAVENLAILVKAFTMLAAK